MYISKEDKEYLVRELQAELHARLDGGRKNLIVPECIWCGKTGGKLGIYVGPEKNGKVFGMAHCFSCGRTCKDVNRFVEEQYGDVGAGVGKHVRWHADCAVDDAVVDQAV